MNLHYQSMYAAGYHFAKLGSNIFSVIFNCTFLTSVMKIIDKSMVGYVTDRMQLNDWAEIYEYLISFLVVAGLEISGR